MYIEPNTSIYILKGVPLDPTYDHTIYWYDINAQVNYFYSKVKYTFARQTYQRVNRGYMRIQRKAEDLYDCNYLMFQNTAFGNKWFFAFITEINYVNNEVSEVKYQIDVMQTYHFDYSLGQCFVEREHSETDVAGDNLVPENLDCGNYITDSYYRTGYLEDNSIVIAAPFFKDTDNIYKPSFGGKYAGLFGGLHYTVFNEDTIDPTIPGNTPEAEAVKFIQDAGEYQTQIVSMFYYPTDMLPDPNSVGGVSAPVNKEVTIPKKQSGSIDGYTPKNNKLYTYPYNFLVVSNLQGNAAEYAYEFFYNPANGSQATNCKFYLTGDYCPNPTFWLYPQQYKNKRTEPLYQNWAAYEDGISMGGWGQLPWTSDSYKAWLAQNGSSLMVNALSSAASPLMGGTVGASSAGVTIISSLANIEAAHSRMPPQAHGSFSPMSQLAVGVLDFWFIPKHITREYARIIDEYFTKYGYACHRVKEPNRNSRPQFNYVLTVDCLIEALDTTGHGLPADDEATICGIYNKGITFWKNPANIGDYTVNNAPTNQ